MCDYRNSEMPNTKLYYSAIYCFYFYSLFYVIIFIRYYPVVTEFIFIFMTISYSNKENHKDNMTARETMEREDKAPNLGPFCLGTSPRSQFTRLPARSAT